HATVKWPWLADVADGRHVLRLSYATTATDPAGVATSLPVDPADPVGTRALQDASTLLGVPITAERVTGAARVGWYGPDLTAAGLAEGVVGIGEASTGRGLAGIIAAARKAADEILGS
ncbi:protoporphyrinogen oxidase, partial [Curtobacterium flaccumfaciens]|nr:protoporphyrinogen oxidase [Curtobacterium flaccumfaciens]